MKKRTLFLVALCSGLLGALLAWAIFKAPRRQQNPIRAPRKFVPAQTLSLMDASGSIFGLVDAPTSSASTVAFTFTDRSGNPVVEFTEIERTSVLQLFGRSASADLSIMMNPRLSLSVTPPDGRPKTVYSRSDWLQKSGVWGQTRWLAKELLFADYHAVISEKPETRLDDLIPDQDVSLGDANGGTWAVLGLARDGRPTMALVDRNGWVLVLWELERDGLIYLSLYDRHGRDRIHVDFESGQPPQLTTIIEPASAEQGENLGAYTLDPHSYEEIPTKPDFGYVRDPAKQIKWLRPMDLNVSAPIAVVDQRDRAVWRAP